MLLTCCGYPRGYHVEVLRLSPPRVCSLLLECGEQTRPSHPLPTRIHPIQAACSLPTRAQHTLTPHHTNRKRHLRRARHAPPLRRRGPRPVAACSPRSIWRKQVVRCGNASGAGQNADRFCHDVSNSELRGEGRAEGRGAQGRSGEGARGERCCRAVRSQGREEGRRAGWTERGGVRAPRSDVARDRPPGGRGLDGFMAGAGHFVVVEVQALTIKGEGHVRSRRTHTRGRCQNDWSAGRFKTLPLYC